MQTAHLDVETSENGCLPTPPPDAVEPTHMADSQVAVPAVVIIHIGAKAAVPAIQCHRWLLVLPVVLTILVITTEALSHHAQAPDQAHQTSKQQLKVKHVSFSRSCFAFCMEIMAETDRCLL